MSNKFNLQDEIDCMKAYEAKTTMSNTPLPEPVRTPLPKGALMGMLAIMDEYARAHAAAVSAAKDARIKELEERIKKLEGKHENQK